uniref:Uncharacterized protein n=1 Tax=Cacopsylla melanoneura TaxID=428564 RepID=A0A8D9EVA5_9HEMI
MLFKASTSLVRLTVPVELSNTPLTETVSTLSFARRDNKTPTTTKVPTFNQLTDQPLTGQLTGQITDQLLTIKGLTIKELTLQLLTIKVLTLQLLKLKLTEITRNRSVLEVEKR